MLNNFLQKHTCLLIDRIQTSAKAHMLSNVHKKSKRPLLILSGASYDKLCEDMQFFSKEAILEFPAWDSYPEEKLFFNPDISGSRIQTLYSLHHAKSPIVFCPISAAFQKTLKKGNPQQQFFIWEKGHEIDFEKIEEILLQLGYTKTSVVADKTEFAIRGGIIDIFASTQTYPYRIEFFGNEIDNIRIFDPADQKTIEKIEKAKIFPAKEILELGFSTIFDYLQDPIIVIDEIEEAESLLVKVQKYQQFPSRLTMEDFQSFLQKQKKLYFASQAIEDLSSVEIKEKQTGYRKLQFEFFRQAIEAVQLYHPYIDIFEKFSIPKDRPYDLFFSNLSNIKTNVQIATVSEKEENNFIEKLKDIPFVSNIEYTRGFLSSSFALSDLSTCYLSSHDFSKYTHIRRKKQRSSYHTPQAEFHQLSVGDCVVHMHSGIGKYLGMEKQQNIAGESQEFIVIEYAENSKLFVPISQAHLVSRYIGAKEEKPQLSTLGSMRWQKTKQQAQKQIIGYAADLLDLYAHRSMEKGIVYLPDTEEMQLFEMDFSFQETPDQKAAIQSLKQDMESSKTMERLICGDVGYGKTEVAMRAAFKAISCGKKQVAVLVPTTILAMQHYETFIERMRNFSVNIGLLSRFQKAAVNREVVKKVKEGKIDVLVGTHRLLSKDIAFADLGLVIIDEEQRFGVRAKEHLKKLKKGVDCITLSATPIPRTLYMSMIEARDMSVINTPPQDRLPIKTLIIENDDTVIKQAVQREINRNGQVFFIHNAVESIYARMHHLQKLMPDITMNIVHGQMSADEVDTIFHQFKNHEIQMLLATTIVENGVDIPNANTILIDRAHHFGLADLYQLRGRVGRWNRMAFAYFIVPKHRSLSEISQKRLHALVEAGGYGGGMKIALRDLEIRGAGDILGIKQSGQVAAIGFHLYCKLLKQTVQALKEKKPISFIETKIETKISAHLPEDYINESNLRMEIYYRLGEASSLEEIDKIFAELQDRFGKPPKAVIFLYYISRLRVFASQKQYTLIKIEKFIIHAERKKGKKIEKRLLNAPRCEPSKEWEKEIFSQL